MTTFKTIGIKLQILNEKLNFAWKGGILINQTKILQNKKNAILRKFTIKWT